LPPTLGEARARSRRIQRDGEGRGAGTAAHARAIDPIVGVQCASTDHLWGRASARRHPHAAGAEPAGLRRAETLVSKARKAATIAAVPDVQYGLAVVTRGFLLPPTLPTPRARSWGLWLAGSEVLGYAGMVDLGILSVMPWILAAAIGRGDRAEQKTLMSQGLWLGAGVGALYVAAAFTAWHVLSPKMFLDSA